MTIRFVECHGFGSGFALGAVQAGLELVSKVEGSAAFGASNAMTNRHLLGDNWELQVDSKNEDGLAWEPTDAEVLLGNPPCSAWSSATQSKAFRGIDSPASAFMWSLVGHAARVRPQVVVLESVQGAYTRGLELMNALHAELEDLTDESWSLTHVLHNNLSVGGVSMRKRYFWVASRVPFGVEHPQLDYVPTVDDALHDLEDLPLDWAPQTYTSAETRWSGQLRNPEGTVDGHQLVHNNAWRRAEMVAENLGGWPAGASLQDLLRAHDKQFGGLPGDPSAPIGDPRLGWQYPVDDLRVEPDEHGLRPKITRAEHLRRREYSLGLSQYKRWRPDRHGYVLTGGALSEYVHPHLLRPYTHREAARIIGFPDAWRISPQQRERDLPALWGKGVPVHSGQWIAEWIKASLEGNPGSVTGNLLSDGHKVIDVTNDWHTALGEHRRDYYARTAGS